MKLLSPLTPLLIFPLDLETFFCWLERSTSNRRHKQKLITLNLNNTSDFTPGIADDINSASSSALGRPNKSVESSLQCRPMVVDLLSFKLRKLQEMLTRRDSCKQTDAKIALLGARNVGKSGELFLFYSMRFGSKYPKEWQGMMSKNEPPSERTYKAVP